MPGKPVSQSPAGYDLNKPIIMKLPTELAEISGLSYRPQDTSLLAIIDEDGILYKIRPHNPGRIDRWKFGISGDYEDLVVVRDTLYVLRSNGTIVQTFITKTGSATSIEFAITEKGNEFEGLYYDSATNHLVLLCKDCDADKKRSLSTFGFELDGHQFCLHTPSIDAGQIARGLGEEKIKFKPSAVAISPVNGNIFIISAINDALVESTLKGEIRGVYKLDHKMFKQPEGMAFSDRGTLFISNESADAGASNILIFPYNRNTTVKP